MSNLYLNIPQLQRWREDNGDYTHSLNYNLNENSIIMDLGGYTGVWAQQMVARYNCNVYVVEPVMECYNTLLERFKNNPKVHILGVGAGTEDSERILYVNGDSTSSNVKSENAIKVQIKSIESILKQWNLQEVDLLQVNIEGDEYPLLQHMINTGSIEQFKNIQVQFHLGIDNVVEKYDKICAGLEERGFKVKYSYPFVWEAWTKV